MVYLMAYNKASYFPSCICASEKDKMSLEDEIRRVITHREYL